MFWIFTFFLFFVAMLFVLVPLVRARGFEEYEDGARKETNISLFKERESELKAELASSIIDVNQFRVLISELKLNLLSDVEDAPKENKQSSNKKKDFNDNSWKKKVFSLNILLPILLIFLTPLLAYDLYGRWGYFDDVTMMPLYQRTVSNFDDLEEAQELIVSLGQAVQANENQPWAWYFLAENFANIGMFNEAEIAYTRSAGLLDETPERAVVLGRVAMTKYINADLQFTPEVSQIVDEARAINPNEVTILQLLASNASAIEDYSAAIGYWRLLIQVNPNSEQAQILRENIAAAQEILATQEPSEISGPIIDIELSLSDNLELDDNLRVFVAARNADREGMPPLAATDLIIENLPITIRLDNSSAVGPFNLASADNVFVSALISQTGTATPQTGDYRVVSENFSHNNELTKLELIISERVN